MNKPTLKVTYNHPQVPKQFYGDSHVSVLFTYPATGNYKAFFALNTKEPDDQDQWDQPDPTIGIEYKDGLFIAEFICGKHLQHMIGIGSPDIWAHFCPRETRLAIIECKGIDITCCRIDPLTHKEIQMKHMKQTDKSVELHMQYLELSKAKGIPQEKYLKGSENFAELSDDEVQAKVDELKAQKEGKLLQWREAK